MKNIIAVVVILLLGGCFRQTINSTEIGLAEELCADRGGIYTIEEYWTGITYFYCEDGSLFTETNGKLTPSRYNKQRG